MKRFFCRAGKLLLLLLCLAASALPAVYTGSVYGYLPVLLLVSALVLSLFWLLPLRRGLYVALSGEDVRCPRGGVMTIGILAENRSPFLCPKAIAAFRVSDPLGGAAGERIFTFSLGGRRSARLELELDMPHVGCCEIGIRELRVFGFFGLASLSIPCVGSFSALVMPRLWEAETPEYRGTELRDSDRDSRVTAVGGTDYTGVREYAIGDPMKQIHWKLSAHSRGYVTKLQESSRRQEFAVLLDFCAAEAADDTLLEFNDCLIETALSLAAAVSRQEAECALLYADASGSLQRSVRPDEEAIPALLRSFANVRGEGDGGFPDAVAMLRQEARSANRAAHVLVITARVTEELLAELQLVKHQRRNPVLFRVVPAAWTSRERDDEALRLRALDALEIPFHLVSITETVSA